MTSFIVNIEGHWLVRVDLDLFDPALFDDGVDVFRAIVTDQASDALLADLYFECPVDYELWDIVNVFIDAFKDFMEDEVV
jgi:hypothetical protein